MIDDIYQRYAIPLANMGLNTMSNFKDTFGNIMSRLSDLTSGRPLSWDEKLAMKYLTALTTPFVSALGKLPTEANQALMLPAEIGYRGALSDYYSQLWQQSKISPQLMQEFMNILQGAMQPATSTTPPQQTTTSVANQAVPEENKKKNYAQMFMPMLYGGY